MTDEKFTFVEDVKEKKMASRSARNRMAHTGKGGKVRFPHDNLTRKEMEAMNGEIRCYRMNDPMKWEDFKTMPVDLQVQYIKAIRNRWHVSDSCIARMMGVNQSHFSHHAQKIGVALGRGTGNQKSDKDGFLAWCSGAEKSKISGDTEEAREISSAPDGEVCETAGKNEAHVADAAGSSKGSVVFPAGRRPGKDRFRCPCLHRGGGTVIFYKGQDVQMVPHFLIPTNGHAEFFPEPIHGKIVYVNNPHRFCVVQYDFGVKEAFKFDQLEKGARGEYGQTKQKSRINSARVHKKKRK